MRAGANAAEGRLGLMLSELRLPTIKRMAGDLCAQSDREGWPGQRLLEAVLEHEIAERETRRIDRHRAESQLSPDKRLSSFDFAAVPSVSPTMPRMTAARSQFRPARKSRSSRPTSHFQRCWRACRGSSVRE